MRTIISALAALMVAVFVVANVTAPAVAQGTLGPQGDITAVHTPDGGGLEGGVAKGAAHLTLTTLCGPSQILKWDGSKWQCAADSTGVGGSGTTNTIAKWTAPGTLGSSLISESGSSVTVGSSTAQSHNLNGRLVGTSTAAHALLLTHTTTGSTSSANAASITANGTFDTTAGAVMARGLAISQEATRSAGSNALNNTGLRVNTFGAQTNAAIDTVNGDNYFNSASGSSGIGYAYGFALPAKLSVNGTLNATGAITEASDRVISLAGSGMLKSGRTLSIDDAYVQRRVSGSCAAGSSIRAIAADGTVTCDDTGAPKIVTIGTGGSGAANNLDCGAGTNVCRLNYNTLTATGFVAGTDGQEMDVLYVGTSTMTLQHQNTSSTAGNRVIMPGAAAWTVENGGGFRMRYDGAPVSRWRVLGPTNRLPSATIAGPASVGTTLGVTGAATLSHSLDVMGESTLFSTLDVHDAATLRGGVTIGGHQHTRASDPSPTLSSCGTSPTIVGRDIAFTITTGAGATACTIDFAAAWTGSPTCVVSSVAGKGVSYTVDASKVQIVGTAAGETYHAICMGH